MAALIKHSGYFSLVTKYLSDPNPKMNPSILALRENFLQGYFAKVTKLFNSLNSLDSTGTYFSNVNFYEIVCTPIIKKAELLLEINPCEESVVISESLGSISISDADLQDSEFCKRFENSVIKSKEAVSFLFLKRTKLPRLPLRLNTISEMLF